LEGIAEIHQDLVAVVPTGFPALDNVDESAGIPGIGVVVTGEEIPIGIEGEFLGVAQASVELLEIGAVRIAAENTAGVGPMVVTAFLGGEGIAAVTDGPVELAVGAPGESVHVVARDAHAHTEAVL